MATNRSIRVIIASLESAHRQATNSRQILLEQRQYEEYLLLAEFCQILNAALVELTKILISQQGNNS